MGQWQRALEQLQLCGQLDAKALAMAQTYREAIVCEVFRTEVFAGRRRPQVLGKPPAWVGALIEALQRDASGDAAGAAGLRAQAMEAAEPAPCSIDGVACEWLMDGDTRLGPVCEIIVNGQYYWMPFESCSGIQIDPPADLRDMVWSPAEVMLPNEGRVPALIPTRYPELAGLADDNADELKQSHVTQWIEAAPGTWFGAGQRVWMSDAGEHPILDTRLISMLATAAATADAAPAPV
jgi:type VI secretion system protein ImpE